MHLASHDVATRRVCRAISAVVLLVWTLADPGSAAADSVAVRYVEGLLHGFLVLRSTGGTVLADGDLTQTAQGDRVTTRVVFHFKDGSVQDETAVFTQRGHFRLVSDRLVQRGPTFPTPIDMTIDAGSGRVTVKYEDDGKSKEETKDMTLPADLANGIIPIVMKNVTKATFPKTLSYLAATPSPRLVKLELSATEDSRFSTGSIAREATHYVFKVDIGGVSGLLAPLVGKQPPDSHVWILDGPAPAFIRAEQPLYVGGPMSTIELVSPTGPRAGAASR